MLVGKQCHAYGKRETEKKKNDKDVPSPQLVTKWGFLYLRISSVTLGPFFYIIKITFVLNNGMHNDDLLNNLSTHLSKQSVSSDSKFKCNVPITIMFVFFVLCVCGPGYRLDYLSNIPRQWLQPNVCACRVNAGCVTVAENLKSDLFSVLDLFRSVLDRRRAKYIRMYQRCASRTACYLSDHWMLFFLFF